MREFAAGGMEFSGPALCIFSWVLSVLHVKLDGPPNKFTAIQTEQNSIVPERNKHGKFYSFLCYSAYVTELDNH